MDFMSFFHAKDEVYPRDTVFTRERLSQITPKAVYIKAFGKTNGALAINLRGHG
jgi:hypothetical protein